MQLIESDPRFLERLRDLPPSSFAAVMATGIIGTVVYQNGWLHMADAFLWFNAALYGALLLALLLRCLCWPQRVWADFADASRGVGFLTLVAATAVLDSQWLLLGGAPRIGMALLGWTALLWGVLGYGFLACVISAAHKPSSDQVLHGGWLLLVVATQALAIAMMRTSVAPMSVFAALCLFLMGSALYGVLMTLLFQRLVLMPLRAEQFTSTYWISMGALAISTLAGGLLTVALPQHAVLAELQPFVRGWTLLLWALGTWWVPLLVLLGVWKYGVRRHPIRYHVDHWSVVFPLGMYSACTFMLAQHVVALPMLRVLAQAAALIALLAWAMVSTQALLHLCRSRAGA